MMSEQAISPDVVIDDEGLYTLDGDPPQDALTDAEPDAGVIESLARLSPVEYDRRREAEATKLGIRVTTLDREVARLRRRDVDAPSDGGTETLFPDVVPWPKLVDGEDLLTTMAATFRKHLVLPAGAADALALWVLHAHAHDASSISPILSITSPTPECGKTTALTVLAALVPKALPGSNITAAALFRAVEKWQPTLLIDEADTFLGQRDELRGVLNSGHSRAAAFVIRTTGDDHEPRRFRTWSPKAIAAIGDLHPTLASRSIHIELRRMGPGEHVEPAREGRLGHLDPLIRKAARWTSDHFDCLRGADPNIPATLAGRRADNWHPLLAIADTAGGDWPLRARRAAEALTGTDRGETAGVMLLADIRTVLRERGLDRISSADLAVALGEMLDRPWPEWRAGNPITQTQVARLLKPFKIGPRQIRVSCRTLKGYHIDQFTDAFSRYLPSGAETAKQPNDSADFEGIEGDTSGAGVSGRLGSKAAGNSRCFGVSPRDGTAVVDNEIEWFEGETESAP